MKFFYFILDIITWIFSNHLEHDQFYNSLTKSDFAAI